jgi:hypothetical protein
MTHRLFTLIAAAVYTAAFFILVLDLWVWRP